MAPGARRVCGAPRPGSPPTACGSPTTCADGRLDLAVSDDGCGLPPGRAGGLGLRSMAERAAELGGECTVVAAGDTGTRVAAMIPLEGAGMIPLEAGP